jgi:hypothetical protein
MKFPRFLLVCASLLAVLWAGAVQALPTVDEVQAAAQRGDYAGAEKMMREVVAAKPDSARAHYVLAEILAHQRQFNEAAEHARRARALDPAIKFTDAARFKSFEQLLQREQAAAAKPGLPAPLDVSPAPAPRNAPPAPVERASGGGVPVWLLVVVAVIFIGVVVSWARRRAAVQTQPAMAGGYGGGYGPGGYGAGMPQQPTSGGPGLMGMGMAAAGGVAAGMLAERLLHGGHDERSLSRDASAGGSGGGAGGLIPGSFGGDAGAADELTRRDIDFGSGDGWDGGGGGDFGGGGSDDW